MLFAALNSDALGRGESQNDNALANGEGMSRDGGI